MFRLRILDVEEGVVGTGEESAGLLVVVVRESIRGIGVPSVTPQCYGCIDHVHSIGIIIYSKHIMIIIYLEPCHSMQNVI